MVSVTQGRKFPNQVWPCCKLIFGTIRSDWAMTRKSQLVWASQVKSAPCSWNAVKCILLNKQKFKAQNFSLTGHWENVFFLFTFLYLHPILSKTMQQKDKTLTKRWTQAYLYPGLSTVLNSTQFSPKDDL